MPVSAPEMPTPPAPNVEAPQAAPIVAAQPAQEQGGPLKVLRNLLNSLHGKKPDVTQQSAADKASAEASASVGPVSATINAPGEVVTPQPTPTEVQ